jgi:hypothetical protein
MKAELAEMTKSPRCSHREIREPKAIAAPADDRPKSPVERLTSKPKGNL